MVHVVAQVENPYGREGDRAPLAVGMFVEAEIRGRSSGKVFALPRSVLRAGNEVLLVDASSKLRVRPVEVFRTERDRVLVRDGIADGDRILTTPLENAVSGMKVRVHSEDGPDAAEPAGL